MLGICYRQLFHHAPCNQHLYRSSDRLFLKNGIKFHNIRSGGLSAVCGGVVRRYLKHGDITHAIKVHKTCKFLEILDYPVRNARTAQAEMSRYLLQVCHPSLIYTDQPFSCTQISPLSCTQIIPLSCTQITPHSCTQIIPLSRSQISPLSRTQISPLSRTQIIRLSCTQISPLSCTQIIPLSRTQIILCHVHRSALSHVHRSYHMVYIFFIQAT